MNKSNYLKFVLGFLAVILIVFLGIPFVSSAKFRAQLKETTSNVLSAVKSVFRSSKPDFKQIGEVDLTSNKIESVPIKKDEKTTKIKSAAKNKNSDKSAAKEIKNEIKPLENGINSNQNLEIKPEQNSQYMGGTPKSENSQPAVSQDNIVLQTPIDNTQQPTSSQQIADNNQQTNSTSSAINIIISEIMYNLDGADDKREWIEINNIGTESFDTTNLKFYENATNHSVNPVNNSQAVLPAGGYAVIVQDSIRFLIDYPVFGGALFDSSFSLNNTGETISIKNGDAVLNEVNYLSQWGAGGNGKSLQLIGGVWKESSPTLGEINK